MVLNNYSCLDSETDFNVVIIDFGLGKEIEADLTELSAPKGNHMYKSPEVLPGLRDEGFVHPNSDVFSVAAMTAVALCNLDKEKQIYTYDEKELI